MSTKVLERAEIKAVETVIGQHMIEFYALAFSAMPDKQGDRISPKALDAWLASFYAEGKPLPISFTHAAVKDTADPFNIIGYAPADPSHVWTDSYGLRVRAYLETEINAKAEQVYRLTKQGIVTGASVAYIAEAEQPQKDSSTLITKMSVLEAGPCLDPANPDAKILSVKSVEEDEVQTKAVDNSAWDGNRAMGMCNSAADYRSICAAEHTIGEPDQRQHWALPHHYLGQGPNAAGVRNSLSRLPQTQNITDAERASAQRHLDAHMREVNPSAAAEHEDIHTAATVSIPMAEWTELIGAKSGRVISTKNENKIRDAIASLQDVLASLETVTEGKANSEEPEANEEEPPTDWLHKAIAAYQQ